MVHKLFAPLAFGPRTAAANTAAANTAAANTAAANTVAANTAAARTAALAAFAAAVALLNGCGGEDDASAAASLPARTTQQAMALSCDAGAVCWSSELAKSADLKAQFDAIGQPAQYAGEIVDAAGNRLVWAEVAASASAPRTEVAAVWSLCAKSGKCTAGRANYTATGASFVDAAGKALSKLEIGAPVMRKTIKFLNKEDDVTVVGALKDMAQTYKIDADVARAQLQQQQFGKRRLVVLNAYGPELGLDPAPVLAAAKATGVYDSVEAINYVRKSDVFALLPTLTGIDAVVWLGAGVVETGSATSPSKRSLGLTVSRGVFGDHLISGTLVGDLLTAPPLGGPGLIVLAGSQSVPATKDDKSLKILAEQLSDGSRAVVGFSGTVTAAQAVQASAALIGKLAGGLTLDKALLAAGQPMATTLESAGQKAWKFQGKRAAFWGGAAPSKAALTLNVRMAPPRCTFAIEPCNLASYKEAYGQAGGQIPAEQTVGGHANFRCQTMDFDGPWFTCSGKDDNTKADFAIRGVMRGRGVGDRMWLVVEGTANNKYKQVFAIGEGVFEGEDKGGGRTALTYRGLALSGTYRDVEDRCCTPGGPALEGMLGEPGMLEIWP